MSERDIPGIWIPIEIWEDSNLTPFEKMLLGEINSFDSGEGCYAHTKRLVEQMKKSISHLDNCICSLVKRGYLIRLKTGHKRNLRTCFSRHLKKVQPTFGSRFNLLLAVGSTIGLNKETPRNGSAGGIGNPPRGPLELSKSVLLFAEYSTKHGYHIRKPNGTKTIYSKGAQNGGWSRQTLVRWQNEFLWLAKKIGSKKKVLQVVRWYIRNADDPAAYVSHAQTFSQFVEKFDNIHRSYQRHLKKHGNQEKVLSQPAKTIAANGYAEYNVDLVEHTMKRKGIE
jgi:hypothetical protein